jgi:hypothetical protein
MDSRVLLGVVIGLLVLWVALVVLFWSADPLAVSGLEPPVP